jgi:hypothetical protein
MHEDRETSEAPAARGEETAAIVLGLRLSNAGAMANSPKVPVLVLATCSLAHK